MKNKLDFDKARDQLANFDKRSLYKKFSEYSPAYPITNEDPRFAAGLQNLADARVLANAGSGDLPI
jgi:hypothetical protein